MILKAETASQCYDIVIERGAINTISHHISLDRRVLVVTDGGVPGEYAQSVAKQCKTGVSACLKQGEQSKSFATLEGLCKIMLEHNFSRGDLVIAVGGGVVGDISALAASVYMRGIDFVNIPTTTLSQIDSSVGGKTALNLASIKNVIGTFYQPSLVIVDPNLLETLPSRHKSAGLVEALKAALLSDPDLLTVLETEDIAQNIEKILALSISVKLSIVAEDEREQGKRAWLNLGHTLGHGYESAAGFGALLHGECVALGLIPMLDSAELIERVQNVLRRLGVVSVPPQELDTAAVMAAIAHDKKSVGEQIATVRIEQVGKPYIKKVTLDEIKGMLEASYEQ